MGRKRGGGVVGRERRRVTWGESSPGSGYGGVARLAAGWQMGGGCSRYGQNPQIYAQNEEKIFFRIILMGHR